MKRLLIASYDLEVGGVERSLLSMLEQFDYAQFDVELMLYRHQGDFMSLLPEGPVLLPEDEHYATFRQSIKDVFASGHPLIGSARLLAKAKAGLHSGEETGYRQMQYMWRYARPFLPKMDTAYDVAISYLWPHDYVAFNVQAPVKLAWVHTDFSTVRTDREMDLAVWDRFTHIIAVSDACKETFCQTYPALAQKVLVVENVISPSFVEEMANTPAAHPIHSDERFRIVTVGRLSHAKGIDQAIEAMKHLVDRGYDFAWYVVGYGGDEGMLRERIAQHGLERQFILAGKQLNPYTFMKEADLYVQPSRYEGKAVTVSEAQILGRPVMITNYPTASSQVTHGVDGYICELSPEGIADGIEQLYHDVALRHQLAETCRTASYQNGQELKKIYQLV